MAPNPREIIANPGSLSKRIKTASVIADNKEEIARLILTMAGTTLKDVIEWDDNGIRVKPSSDIPEQKLHAIKKIKQTTAKDGTKTLEIEMVDKVQLARILAKGAGLLDPVSDEDARPSILGINVKGPQ